MSWKKCLFGLALAVIWYPTLAQNALFVHFGQTVAEVDSFLNTKDYLADVYQADDKLIEVKVHEGRRLRYHFEEGYLYEIEEIREFYDHKLKESLVKNCLDFLKQTEEKVKVLKTEGVDSHYAVAPEDRVLEFTVTESGKKRSRKLEMTFTSTSRYYGPRMDTEAYVSQLED